VSPQQILTTVMTHTAANQSTDHAKPHFDLFFTTISTSKKMFFSERELKKALRDTLTPAALSGLLLPAANSQSDYEISSNCGKISF